MRFFLIDKVLERTDERIVAIKHVTLAEEYLKDHFADFPVLPGVFMIEAMVQAARELLEEQAGERLVLGDVRALKFGSMVRPSETLVVEVTLKERDDQGHYVCRGVGRRSRTGANSPIQPDAGETAVSGRFTMRPLRTD